MTDLIPTLLPPQVLMGALSWVLFPPHVCCPCPTGAAPVPWVLFPSQVCSSHPVGTIPIPWAPLPLPGHCMHSQQHEGISQQLLPISVPDTVPPRPDRAAGSETGTKPRHNTAGSRFAMLYSHRDAQPARGFVGQHRSVPARERQRSTALLATARSGCTARQLSAGRTRAHGAGRARGPAALQG